MQALKDASNAMPAAHIRRSDRTGSSASERITTLGTCVLAMTFRSSNAVRGVTESAHARLLWPGQAPAIAKTVGVAMTKERHA